MNEFLTKVNSIEGVDIFGIKCPICGKVMEISERRESHNKYSQDAAPYLIGLDTHVAIPMSIVKLLCLKCGAKLEVEAEL